MRVRSFFLITGLILAGGVAARPEEVVPLASRLIAPMLSHRAKNPVVVEAAVPGFVPSGRDLSFAKSEAGDPSQALALAPVEHPNATPVGVAPGSAARGTLTPPDPNAVEVEMPIAVEAIAPAVMAALAMPPAVASFGPVMPQAPLNEGLEGGYDEQPAVGQPPAIAAKKLFGAVKSPSPLATRSIGSYARGCIAGAVALPVDGPAWQAMRLSRNRNWGHPRLISLVEKFATESQKIDGWPGLLVGDISQPRGGPMLTGHASHQVGLDADVWLTAMPNRRLSNQERENIAATSMLDKTELAVDPKVFTADQVKLIKRAASYSEVERVLVHPAIKKALCKAADGDRRWLTKVRPIQGHYYHFHIRISCPPGSPGCQPQKPPPGDDGCGKEVDEWLARLAAPPRPSLPPVPGAKPAAPPPQITMAQLPTDCRAVLESGPDGIAAPAEVRPPGHAAARTAATGVGRHIVLQPRSIRHAHK